ncbi:hypothetical protein CEP54_002186 [Fusarium duplospermum]|uniref:Uncharacterized protein n=1 Tax=Fusarium duplospermum TaxID=1325734 RepID=A0A428QWP8_9HYPO|nr:hypothetical protein CEP54_002186 [Fusarium duplospermum]
MSDGIAPAIDKVGAPDPKAPEAEAAAPTMDTTTAPSEPAKSEDNKPTGLSAPPKPVEVMSVPETPINNRTPAGGTPRPELNIEEEPKEPAKNEDEVAFITTGVETGSTPAVSAPKDATMTDKPADDKPTEAATNGASKPSADDVTEAAAGEKRKLGEAAPATNGAAPAEAEKAEPEERAKKARVEDVADEPTATETATNGKGTKAKKEKKTPPAVGKTARKTRSQGPVEAE